MTDGVFRLGRPLAATPLAPIRNAAAALGHIPTTETTLQRMQAIIERQVVHMTRLIGDLIDVPRAGTGKLRIDRQIVDIVDAAIDVSRPAMDTRLQSFVVQVPSCALTLQGSL